MLAGLARIRKTAYPVGAPSIATDGSERCNENPTSSWLSGMRRDQDLSDRVEPVPPAVKRDLHDPQGFSQSRSTVQHDGSEGGDACDRIVRAPSRGHGYLSGLRGQVLSACYFFIAASCRS